MGNTGIKNDLGLKYRLLNIQEQYSLSVRAMPHWQDEREYIPVRTHSLPVNDGQTSGSIFLPVHIILRGYK